MGDYFLAEFVENRDGEDVTLEGCYKFCAVRVPLISTYLLFLLSFLHTNVMIGCIRHRHGL